MLAKNRRVSDNKLYFSNLLAEIWTKETWMLQEASENQTFQ